MPTDAPLAPQPDGILPPLPAVLMANPAARHLAARLEVERLIGVVGPPGAGKTWLALETAHALAAREWPVWWLSARSASSPVVGAGALVSRVRGTPAILFLDGVDADRHAVEAAVLRLLQAHPGLRVVLVGRRPPAVYGASVHGVPDRASPDAVGAIPKGTEALFAHALAWHRPAGGANALAPPDVRTVLEIADGLALAVVRAAAHCASRPAAELVGNAEGVLDRLDGAHLDRRFEAALLSSALEDGHAGLSPPERAVLRRLATFPGAFDRSAAAHVCGGVGTDVAPEAVPEILARLVDGLLVVRAASVAGASRFRLVRPVRWHARRKLAEAGEARAAARRWLEASAGNPAG